MPSRTRIAAGQIYSLGHGYVIAVRDIYVMIEDAAEVDARENAERPEWRVNVQYLSEAEIRALFPESIIEWQNVGAIRPGTIVPVARPETATQAVAGQELRRAMEEEMRLRFYQAPRVVDRDPEAPNAEAILQWVRNNAGGQAAGYRRSEAADRAHNLLLTKCTPAQREEWEQHRQLHATGSTGGLYCLDLDGVIRTTDHHTFCLQIVGDHCPPEDAVLMRKLLIETDEPKFLRMANDLSAREATPYLQEQIARLMGEQIVRLMGEFQRGRAEARWWAEARADARPLRETVSRQIRNLWNARRDLLP